MNFLRKYRFYVLITAASLITGLYVNLMFYARYLLDSQYINRESERMMFYDSYHIISLINISSVVITTLLISLIAMWLGYRRTYIFLIIFFVEAVIWFL